MSNTTEIQRIPGRFNLPAGWPRMVIPDLTTALLADWRAEDLSAGVMGAAGWPSVAGTGAEALKLVPAETRAWPVVGTDGTGNKYVRFVNSYLQAAVRWNGPITVVAVVRPDADASGVQRIFSGPPGSFRALARQGGGFVASVSGASKNLNSLATPGEIAIVAARYAQTALDGIQYGRPWSTAEPLSGYPQQNAVSVGSNMANVGAEGFFKGDIYRLQVWGRAMENSDIEAAMQSNANIYRA